MSRLAILTMMCLKIGWRKSILPLLPSRENLWSSQSINDHGEVTIIKKKTRFSQPKANLLSPILTNLDRTANMMAPCTIGTSSEIDASASGKRMSPIRSTPYIDKNTIDNTTDATASTTRIVSTSRCRDTIPSARVNTDEKIKVSCSLKVKNMKTRRTIITTTATTVRDKTNDPVNVVVDDDEEIDVERVDDSDPMWRPW